MYERDYLLAFQHFNKNALQCQIEINLLIWKIKYFKGRRILIS